MGSDRFNWSEIQVTPLLCGLYEVSFTNYFLRAYTKNGAIFDFAAMAFSGRDAMNKQKRVTTDS